MTEIQLLLAKSNNQKEIIYHNNLKNHLITAIFGNKSVTKDIIKKIFEKAEKGEDKLRVIQVFLTYGSNVPIKSKIPFADDGWNFTLKELELNIVPILQEINEKWQGRCPGTEFIANKTRVNHMNVFDIYLLILPLPSSPTR